MLITSKLDIKLKGGKDLDLGDVVRLPAGYGPATLAILVGSEHGPGMMSLDGENQFTFWLLEETPLLVVIPSADIALRINSSKLISGDPRLLGALVVTEVGSYIVGQLIANSKSYSLKISTASWKDSKIASPNALIAMEWEIGRSLGNGTFEELVAVVVKA